MTKKTYRVVDGFDHVNGEAVPADRKVTLTEAEARFDLALGRIEPARAAKKPEAEPGE